MTTRCQDTVLRSVLLIILSMCAIVNADIVAGKHFGPAHKCYYNFTIETGKNFDLDVSNFTTSTPNNHYCQFFLTTTESSRVVLDIDYRPSQIYSNFPEKVCQSDYVHVGSDVTLADVNSMTSYKFCGEEIQEELMSKKNHLWLAYKATEKPRQFFVKVHALKPVICSQLEQYSCSPVQCVDRSVLCDGVKDCANGRDEFCRSIGVGKAQSSGMLSESCFRCGDGTCIQPRLPRYDIKYGRGLWYLCDGFPHCPDAWDENSYFCARLQEGRAGSVTECVPSDLQFGSNGTVYMWNDVKCNSNQDCVNWEDETDCEAIDPEGNKLRADPATIGAVGGVLFTACLGTFVVYRLKVAIKQSSRPSTSSSVDTKCTQCTSQENERSSSLLTSQKYSEAPPPSVNDHPPLDKDDGGEEEDDHSWDSYSFKHTVV